MNGFTGLAAMLALPLFVPACGGDDVGTSDTSNDTGSEDESGTGTAAGCVDDPTDSSFRVEVPTFIDADMTLGCDQVHVLTGITFVNSGTLTIEPGTTILGSAGTALVIDKGATLQAVGTADAPIVMTSLNDPGARSRGDWGGLALIGNAPTNVGEGVAEGFATDPPTYGGDDPSHDCGALSYLRVEWAGNEISPGNELNGITFYACGTQTSVDHVQVHMGSDDGIEMFGGTFDASNIVITGAADDSVDCDQGYAGNLTNVFIHQDPSIGDNCLEWSNQGNNFSAEPLTSPSISNLTCIGSGAGGDKSKGATLKEGTQADIRSSLFANITNQSIVIANQATQLQAEAGAISLSGTHFCDTGVFQVDVGDEGDPDPITWADADFEAWAMGAGGGTMGTDCGLGSVTWGSPSIQPTAPLDGDGTYAGAVDPAGEDWTAESWINYGT